MSTELTNSRETGLPMVESHSLSVAFLLGEVHAALMAHVAERLAASGHPGVTGSALGFLGQLDCGVNYASAIADRLGVSRQMTAKTVAEMERKGWLRQGTDPQRRNRKVIRFTPEGERLMADARQVLAELDAQCARSCGPGFVADLAERLRRLKASLGGASA